MIGPFRAGRVALLAAIVAVVGTQVATAQSRGRRPPRLAQVVEWLDSGDVEDIRRGIESVGLLGSSGAVQRLEDRVRRGLPGELLLLAVHTLGATGRSEARPLVSDLLSHRRVAIRVAAVRALTDIGNSETALIRALSDPAPEVRSAAAESLGQVGSTASIDPLFRAFDRGVEEAATSLGQIVRNEEVPRLLGYLGDRSLETMSPALLEVLSREEIRVSTKVDLVGQLSEMATGDVRRFLEDYAASLPQGAPADLRRAVQNAAGRIAQ